VRNTIAVDSQPPPLQDEGGYDDETVERDECDETRNIGFTRAGYQQLSQNAKETGPSEQED
jgi:hypothetical protein